MERFRRLALYRLQKGQASRISAAKSLPESIKAIALDSLSVSAMFLCRASVTWAYVITA